MQGMQATLLPGDGTLPLEQIEQVLLPVSGWNSPSGQSCNKGARRRRSDMRIRRYGRRKYRAGGGSAVGVFASFTLHTRDSRVARHRAQVAESTVCLPRQRLNVARLAVLQAAVRGDSQAQKAVSSAIAPCTLWSRSSHRSPHRKTHTRFATGWGRCRWCSACIPFGQPLPVQSRLRRPARGARGIVS